MKQFERRQYLLKYLLDEQKEYENLSVPDIEEQQKELLRGLMNVRAPRKIEPKFLEIQDKYLKEELLTKGVIELSDLTSSENGIHIWQGDITRLATDAIVNAANSGMTGCYVPSHPCIDNCIHSFSGIQLRLDCAAMMRKQGYEEPTGQAKITKAYNLPSKYVIHTVGPIIRDRLTTQDCKLLASCYQSCLELAAQNHLESIAFCCISTGEFHFPNDKAAEIAVRVVTDFQKKNTSIKKVVFNVFKNIDKEIYERRLKQY